MTGFVVAPSAVTVRMMEQLLRRAGCTEVKTWQDGAEALTALSQSPDFDLLVAEWDLPGASGMDLVRSLTRNAAGSPSSILVTTRNTGEDVREALEAGVSAYLLKPLDPDVFVERAMALLKERGKLDEPGDEEKAEAA